jgi:hypothetical protein
MSTLYEQRRQARLARLRQRAASARQEAQQHQHAAHAITQHIPLAQPILVGHHSERRHRRDLDRIHSLLEKSWQAQSKATALDQRAQAAAYNQAISSRDPEALAKLQAKLATLEAKQAEMKRITAADRLEHFVFVLAGDKVQDMFLAHLRQESPTRRSRSGLAPRIRGAPVREGPILGLRGPLRRLQLVALAAIAISKDTWTIHLVSPPPPSLFCARCATCLGKAACQVAGRAGMVGGGGGRWLSAGRNGARAAPRGPG